ncbi:MAG: hypothetical protein JWM21_1435 [Acidobacteria bacterium]|nr:hypothetical protein [Acidobacteriota bacterium]
MSVSRILFVAMLVVVVLLAAAPTDLAQCAMCRASLAGSNNATFIRNLNIGVLVLLIPPVTIFCSIFVVLRRHKGEGKDDDA